jgi:hypothetical protein
MSPIRVCRGAFPRRQMPFELDQAYISALELVSQKSDRLQGLEEFYFAEDP